MAPRLSKQQQEALFALFTELVPIFATPKFIGYVQDSACPIGTLIREAAVKYSRAVGTRVLEEFRDDEGVYNEWFNWLERVENANKFPILKEACQERQKDKAQKKIAKYKFLKEVGIYIRSDEMGQLEHTVPKVLVRTYSEKAHAYPAVDHWAAENQAIYHHWHHHLQTCILADPKRYTRKPIQLVDYGNFDHILSENDSAQFINEQNEPVAWVFRNWCKIPELCNEADKIIQNYAKVGISIRVYFIFLFLYNFIYLFIRKMTKEFFTLLAGLQASEATPYFLGAQCTSSPKNGTNMLNRQLSMFVI
jgi:hypothetical protein